MAISGVQDITVIGSGQMGQGIAQVCASKGLTVTLIDVSPQQLELARQNIDKSSAKLFEKGKITEQEHRLCGQISYAQAVTGEKPCDLLIEAIVEKSQAKKEIFSHLDKLLPAHTIFASNTSSLPITELAAVTSRPDKFIGMHFMNPVPLMKLVEVIPGLATSEKVSKKIISLAEGLGKEVSFSKDYPGFVVNRILMPMINEAFTVLQEGIASAEDIDKGMKLGTNQPMGPLTLADFIGLDTCLSIMEVLHTGLGDSKYRPSPLLRQYVQAGWLGRKSKRGVYEY